MKIGVLVACMLVAGPIPAAAQSTAQVTIGSDTFEVPLREGSSGPRTYTPAEFGLLQDEESIVATTQQEYDGALSRLPKGFQPGELPSPEQWRDFAGEVSHLGDDAYDKLSETICGAVSSSCTVWSDKLSEYRIAKPSFPMFVVEYVVAMQFADQARSECWEAAKASLFEDICDRVVPSQAFDVALTKSDEEKMRRVMDGQGYYREVPLEGAVVAMMTPDGRSPSTKAALELALRAAGESAPDDCFGGDGITCGAFRFGRVAGRSALLYCGYDRIPKGPPVMAECVLLGVLVSDQWTLSAVVLEHIPFGTGMGGGQDLFVCTIKSPSASDAAKRIKQALVPKLVPTLSEGLRRDGATILRGINPNLNVRPLTKGGRGWARIEVIAIVRPGPKSTSIDFIVAYDLSATRMRKASDGRYATDQESVDIEGEVERRLSLAFGEDQCGFPYGI